jgi:hypothetical protein
MCEPTTISLVALGVGAAISAGGAYMQYEGTNAAAKAQNNATARGMAYTTAETARQNQLRDQANSQAEAVTAESGPAAMQRRMQEAEAQRQQGAQAATDADPNKDRLLGGQAGASNVVRTVISDRRGEAAAKLGREALARARLGSWGDAFVNLGETTAPMMDRIGMFGNFARGSSGALGVETGAMNALNGLGAYKGAGSRAIGSGMSGIGNATMSNSGTIGGWFKPGVPAGGGMANMGSGGAP